MNNNFSDKYTKPRYHPMLRLAAFFASMLSWLIIHVLFALCRKYTFGSELVEKLIRENNGKILHALWHDNVLYSLYFFRNRNSGLLLSRSRDAELVVPLLKLFGCSPQRGSSGKGKMGKQALAEFIKHVNKGNMGGITVDGPQGPAHVVKHGIITAGAKTSVSIMPHVWFAQPNICISSWDQTIIPKPFSKIVMIFDRKTINIPENANQQQLEHFRKQLNTRMLGLTYQAEHWFKLRYKYSDPRDIPIPFS
jgi:lysophospholipid acyltransferase (LPLAT)-like uncharacterized protein